MRRIAVSERRHVHRSIWRRRAPPTASCRLHGRNATSPECRGSRGMLRGPRSGLCNSGAPSACNADCAAMLVPYVRECTTTLAQTKDGRDLVPLLQSTVQMCDTQDYMCRCTEGWGGENCDQGRCYGVDCGEHGTCDRATGTCTCSPSFSGPRCETVVGDGFICTRTNWRSGIMPDQPPALTGRGDFARLCSAGYTFEEKCCTHCPKCGHSTDASLGPGECNAASDCSCSCRACDNPPVLIPCECPPGQVSRATNCECECE